MAIPVSDSLAEKTLGEIRDQLIQINAQLTTLNTQQATTGANVKSILELLTPPQNQPADVKIKPGVLSQH